MRTSASWIQTAPVWMYNIFYALAKILQHSKPLFKSKIKITLFSRNGYV